MTTNEYDIYTEWQVFRMTTSQMTIQNDKYLEWQLVRVMTIQNDNCLE